MSIWTLRQRLKRIFKTWMFSSYSYRRLSKALHGYKGKIFGRPAYMVLSSLLLVSMLGFHFYMYSFYYVVSLDHKEIGYVRDAGEIERFLSELEKSCSDLFGLSVSFNEEVALSRESRPGAVENIELVKDTLRQNLTLSSGVIMVTVDGVPVAPVACQDDISIIVEKITASYVNIDNQDDLLAVNLVQDVKGEPCTVEPHQIRTPEEVAAILLADSSASREPALLSRGSTLAGGGRGEEEAPLPEITVVTVHKLVTEEAIPFETSYKRTSSLWTVQSRVIKAGRNGTKQVTYEVTRENGSEVSRKTVAEKILEQPVTQVVERGTSSVPGKGTGEFIWPVEGGGILTQGFKGWSHAGIDITCSNRADRHNTRILAADSGVVVESGSQWPMGNYLVIFHGNYFTLYLHNRVHYVSKGDTVSRGQPIALMGNTGRTRGLDGIHLHFEIRVNDGTGVWNHYRQHAPVNPLNFFNVP